MTTLFISHSPEDALCAETIRHGLEIRGYICWRDPAYPTPTDHSYPHIIESAILGSASLILIWNTHAAQTAEVTRHIQIAQQLQKTILPLVLDTTALPPTLVTPTPPLSGLTSCDDAVAHLVPHLPAPDSQELLLVLSEKAAHEFISNRRTAIELAADMLARDEHRTEVLALLNYLAQHDPMPGVREQAQEVLDTDKQRATPLPTTPFLNPADAQYMLGVRCKKCNHITYFDRRRLCTENRTVKRILRAPGSDSNESDLDEMELPCANCGHLMVIHVDCEGL